MISLRTALSAALLPLLVAVLLVAGPGARPLHAQQASALRAGLTQGGAVQTPPLALIEPLHPQGHFTVEQWQHGRWKPLGNIPADRLYRVQSVRLTGGFSLSPVRVRITKHGGGAAHLDSVLLNGVPPRSASGVPLRKLLARDHDVTNVPTEPIVLEFSRSAADERHGAPALEITGRIEPKVISSTPFQYPLSNMRKPITPQSAFYTYRLGSNPGHLTVNGDLNDESLGKPFLDEYYPVGSGHPQEPTLGWVMDDGKDLYVAFDVVGDNTADGLKDYTKVYVNTPGGVRMFKTSVGDQRWGHPGFEYTPRVGWEHKVYEFAIPLAELGLDAAHRAGAALQLAFAAYGTFSPGYYTPYLAYDSACNTYLGVSGHVDSSLNVYTGVNAYAADGSQVTAPADVTPVMASTPQYNPILRTRSALDPADHRYLVVWSDDRNLTGTYSVYGQLLEGDGTLIGSNLPIASDSDNRQSVDVAFEPNSSRFLVTWTDATIGDVEGILLKPDGSTAGSIFQVAAAGSYYAAVAADPVQGDFLAAWVDSSAVWAERVSSTGSVGTPIQLNKTATAGFGAPSLAYDPDDAEFLVAWDGGNATNGQDIWGRLVNASGKVGANDFKVTDLPLNQVTASTAYDPINKTFLVAYIDEAATPYTIHGYTVDGAGTVGTTNLPLASDTTYAVLDPALAANLTHGGFLLAYHVSSTIPANSVVTATMAPLAGGGGGGMHVPPWGAPLLAAMAALWLAVATGVRYRARLRPLFHAVTLGLALSLALVGVVTACSSGGGGGTQVVCPK